MTEQPQGSQVPAPPPAAPTGGAGRRARKFPLTLHPTGQYCKKIRGKLYYFGQDKQEALRLYYQEASSLHAGQGRAAVPAASLTLKSLCNLYLDYQSRQVTIGEIKYPHYYDQLRYLRTFVQQIGPDKRVSEIRTVDLQQYRAKLIEDGKAPTTINNRLRAVKAVFHWARDDEAYWSQLRDRHHAVNIEFTGEKPHDEAMKMLAAADVFVLPSHTEGFPNVVLEAMALSKPVIATRVGAIPEMLGGDCGLLVEPQDVASLKMALARLMEDRELQRRLGREGYRRAVTQYSIDTVFLQYIDLWKQAIAAG